MVGVLLVARAGLLEAELPAAARLLVLIAAGLAVYVPLCMWRAPEVARDGRALLAHVRRPRVLAAQAQPADSRP